jgi:hypothetical protein
VPLLIERAHQMLDSDPLAIPGKQSPGKKIG